MREAVAEGGGVRGKEEQSQPTNQPRERRDTHTPRPPSTHPKGGLLMIHLHTSTQRYTGHYDLERASTQANCSRERKNAEG